MKKRKTWKDKVCAKLYCRPGLNQKIVCIKSSFDEVARILNPAVCTKE